MNKCALVFLGGALLTVAPVCAQKMGPDLTMDAHDGAQVDLASALDPAHPVFLNFIFTSCSTICPVMSATFAQARKDLGDEADAVRMISISVDPEYDTPARLKEYAGRFGAGSGSGSGWKFLTGHLSDVIRVQRAFDAYRDGKLNHAPLTFLRVPGKTQWVRLEGFPSAAELVREYRQLQTD